MNKLLLKEFREEYISQSLEMGYKGLRCFLVALDMYYCRNRLHCFPNEYKLYRFDRHSHKYRKQFLLQYDQYFTYGKINVANRLNGKIGQYTLLKDYIGRDWIKVEPNNIEEVKSLARNYKKVLFKPANSSLGKGIFTYEKDVDSEMTLLRAVLASLKRDYICEEYVFQHHSISEFHPQSLNCLRILTFYNDVEIKVISASIKIGTSDNVVDNIASNGLGANIDLDTGIINTPAYDHDGNVYYFHPETNKKIEGFVVPYFNEALEMVKNAASLAKENHVIGFDVAIKEDGPIIIEMNNRPSPYLSQGFDKIPRGKEIKEYVRNNPDKLRTVPIKEREKYKKYI